MNRRELLTGAAVLAGVGQAHAFGIGKEGARGGFGSGGVLGEPSIPIVPRTLNIAGSELVLNGAFTSDLSSWTDASTAGGTVAWNSSNGGVARLTNTTANARLRQNPTVISGQVYSFFAQNVATSGVAATVALGSTTPGSTDVLSTNTNAAIAARAGVKEYTAPSGTTYISLSQTVAGNNDWKYVTLRQLIPTVFQSGRVFTDDFSLKSDGLLGVNPDNILWRQMTPQNASHVYPTISGGKMVMAASGAATSAGYPFWNFGTGKVAGIRCDLVWTGSGASCAMVSLTPSGSQPTVTDITTNSLHIVFSDTKVDISTYVAGVLTTETVNYGASITPGVTYTGVGWSLRNNTLTIYLPDGTTFQRTNSLFSQVQGNIGIPEQFYASGVTGSIAISKVSMTLG